MARQDCWLQQGNGIKFDGINMEALFYEYDPQKPIKTNDDKYVYIGNLQIGESKAVNQGKNEPIQFVSPFSYDDVVLWTDGKNLIQYFLDNKFAGLNLTLGEIFTTSNVQEKHTNDPMKIIGGVTLDEEG